jgi:glycosyltransferase involved in cell wall biosynthesis
VARILIAGFCALPGPDRAGVQLRHVMRALVRDHSVDVLVVRRGDQAYVERWGTARLLRVPVPEGDLRSRVEAFRRALRRQIEGADYDIVHFRDGWSGTAVLEMRDRLKYAAVFDVARSPLSEPLLVTREEAVRLERDHDECIRRADLILVPHEPARRYLSGFVSPARVHLVPPGVDVDTFDWEEPDLDAPARVLYMGSLTPGRGVRVLLRAWLDISRELDARLVLAGRSTREFLKSLQNAVRDLELTSCVEFAGEVDHDDVPSRIARATVCVAPGAIELGPRPLGVYPTKILEYLACQRAVIAPRRGTVSMLLRDGQHGLLFEPGQPAHLAEQIVRLLNDPELRGRIARAGYELVRRAHTASGTRRELRKAYDWLSSQSPWRERFLEALDEIPTAHVTQLGTAEVTDASDYGRMAAGGARERPIRAFESDMVELYDGDGSHPETMISEVADVTRVETSPLAGPAVEDDLRSTQPVSVHATAVDGRAASMDEWVVEDSRGRRPIPGAVDDGTPVERLAAPPTSPLPTVFVAGEVDVPTPPPERIEGDTPEVEIDLDAGDLFTAVMPPLGAGDDDSKTDTRAAPAKPPPPPCAPDEDSATQIAAVPPAPRKAGSSPAGTGRVSPRPPASVSDKEVIIRNPKPVDDLT